MAEGQVGRPPLGGISQAESHTAKRAYVAARLEQRGGRDFLDELGVAINRSALSRAGAALLWHPPNYEPRGRKSADPALASRGRRVPEASLRDWLAVDSAALDITASLITFDFESRPQQGTAYRDLRRVEGVVQVATLVRGSREQKHQLLVFVLTDGERDRQRLRERFGEVDGEWAWQDIDAQTVEPAIRTWRHLARVAAEREGLLTSDSVARPRAMPGV